MRMHAGSQKYYIRQFSETPLSVVIVGCGVLTAHRVRHITAPLAWHPASAENGHGAKLPVTATVRRQKHNRCRGRKIPWNKKPLILGIGKTISDSLRP